jgi:hypothetical protein
LDGCPLASCPTAKGIVVEGCPVYNWSSPHVYQSLCEKMRSVKERAGIKCKWQMFIS